jgi:thymidylate kinase
MIIEESNKKNLENMTAITFKEIIRFAKKLDNSEKAVELLYKYALEKLDLDNPKEKDLTKKGTLITFDGHSGAGKDTQIALLEKHVKENYLYCDKNIITLVQKQNPFKQVSKYLWQNNNISEDNNCSLLLLTAGRKYFTYNTLLPALREENSIIISNRSYLSNLAYHASNTQNLLKLLPLAYFDIEADLKFVLECDTKIAYSRVMKRSPEKSGIIYANERPEYINRVKKNYKQLSKFVKNMIFIDTSSDAQSINNNICSYVDNYFQITK